MTDAKVAKKELEKALQLFAEELVDNARNELGRQVGNNPTYGVASGQLQRSLGYAVTVRGQDFALNFGVKGAAKTYESYVYFGVNGTQRRHGSPFTFKKQPPTDVILNWLRVKGVRVLLRDSKGRFKKHTESGLRGVAFVMARAIKRRGLPGVKYWSTAVKMTLPKHQAKIRQAMKADIITGINITVGKSTGKLKA